MYTFNQVLSDDKSKTTRRRTIVVEFKNGEELLSQSFSFSIDTDLVTIKKTVKNYLDELNYVPPIFDGDLTIPDETPSEPSAAELAKQEWQSDRDKLKTLMELVADGVFTGDETQIKNLQTRVRTNFKPTFLD